MKSINDFPNYRVYKNGSVFRGKKKIKTVKNRAGYIVFNCSKEGKVTQLYLHRCLGDLYIPNPQNKPQINHKNGIKSDNRLNNLEWVTNVENHYHALKIGLKKMASGTRHHCYGKTQFEIFGDPQKRIEARWGKTRV